MSFFSDYYASAMEGMRRSYLGIDTGSESYECQIREFGKERSIKSKDKNNEASERFDVGDLVEIISSDRWKKGTHGKVLQKGVALALVDCKQHNTNKKYDKSDVIPYECLKLRGSSKTKKAKKTTKKAIKPIPSEFEYLYNIATPILDERLEHEIKLKEKLEKRKKRKQKRSKELEENIITPKIKVENVILNPDIKEKIMSVVSQKDNSETIFNKWGFEDVYEKGTGMIMLFYGEPGTGKTLMAEAIANHLKTKLYLLDSGNMESHMAGVQEKNITKAFNTARQNNYVLCFDEADSLIMRRDIGNHKYSSGILAREVNHILREIELFEGVCILTSNRAPALDPALERRISMIVEFGRPDKNQRTKIWQHLFAKAPLQKSIDLHKIGEEHDLTGGEIKNIILNAARLCVHKGYKYIREDILKDSIHMETSGHEAWTKDTLYNTEKGKVLDESGNVIQT